MRLFVALEIPGEVRDNFAHFINELSALAGKNTGKGPRWVRAENLHVTLKFVGETSAEKLGAIRNALPSVHGDRPVALQFRGLGFFPSEKYARVLWVGMSASPNLQTLAADIDQALERVGFAREQRPFTPHLTLARFQPPDISEELRAGVLKNIAREFGALRTREFHLIESKLKPTGAEYTTLQSFTFAAEN